MTSNATIYNTSLPLVDRANVTCSELTNHSSAEFIFQSWPPCSLRKTTDQVFVDLRAAVKDFADLRPLDDLVEQLPPVQRDHAHENGVLDEL